MSPHDDPKPSWELRSELEGIQRAIEADLCGDIGELRVRVGQLRAAVGSLVIPVYLSAFALSAIAYRLW
ncbi:hypothetical protein [Novosphingobium beihaiensis]|uniref:Hemolysin XhlA n=1 Tax=Novosphingobium beihaiensis TaxID=2930389 RepID=A0ABT0BND1_9SPHN|nr:hypothetical protein [Novosphingobium beihaiensis]MCJ2186465.1 hypothetical protein [Novosphingobium beihaiensis]